MEQSLVNQGYDILECMNCGKECKPDAKRRNGNIIYEKHFCKSEYQWAGSNKSFEIDVDGEIVED